MSALRISLCLLIASSCAPAPKAVEAPVTAPEPTAAPTPAETAAKPPDARADDDQVAFGSRPALPSHFACDGSLAEWGTLVPGDNPASSRVAVVATPNAVIAAGDMSARFASGVWLSVGFPASRVPPVGDYQRGGGVRELECDHQPYSEEPRTPEDKKRCLEILARHAALVKKHEAAFHRSYHIDEKGVQVASDKGLVEIPGAKAALKQNGGRVSFEVSLPASALPRCAEAPLSGFYLAATADHAPPATDPDHDFALTLETPISFQPSAELWPLLFQHMQPMLMGPFIAYQPGRDDVVSIVSYDGTNTMTVTDVDQRPFTWGPKLGRVQLGYLFSGLDDVIVFVDGKPHEIVYATANKKVMSRDGKLHILSSSEYIEESIGRPVASWGVTLVSGDGTVEGIELDTPDVAWDDVSAYHDASWSTFGVRGIALNPDGKKMRLDVQWKWRPKAHAYMLVKPL